MEEDLSIWARKKAILLARGPVKVAPELKLPVRLSRSTAGPGAGTTGIALTFHGHRVKKAIVREGGDFELVETEGHFALLKDGEPFLESVEVTPVLFHSPEQAFFNIETECIYDCKFCSSRRLEKKVTKNLTPDKIVQMIVDASARPDFKAVALTSAVVKDPGTTVGKMVYIVKRVREALGSSIPIGVEPYVDDLEQIDLLKEAGADEIKLNMETWDQAIFRKVCGELDQEWILKALEHSVKVFGRGKVNSNIIVGMGESDQSVLEGVERLAKMGVVATLRPLRVNELNRKDMEMALGELEPVSEERLLRLAREQKRILTENGLSTLTFDTMCNACTCCDIVPFKDI
ncbi:MAG TPA: radical SAM protein [Methanomassiliicoccales archaeon]|nr:radical SAM protein [Methanomassiliicoccales archaeon]